MKSPSLRVAVTGFDGLDNPHPGWSVARALRAGWEGPLEIDALVYDANETAAWMPGACDAIHLLPSLRSGDRAVLDRMLAIHRERPLDAVMPCLDLEVPVFARLADALQAAGIRTLLPRPDRVWETTKLRLPKWCHREGVLAPRTIHVLDLNDLELHADQFGYPLVVKSTVTGAKTAHDRDEVVHHAECLNNRWGDGVLLQQPIFGDEIVVAATCNEQGRVAGLIPMRKTGVNAKGKAVFGTVIDDPLVVRTAEKIIARLGWRGPLELEFIRQCGTSSLFLIEVNCRFPSWIGLCAWAGANLPVVALKSIIGAKQTRERVRPGATFVRDVLEMAVSLDDIRGLQRTGSVVRPARAPRRKRRAEDGARIAVSGISTFDVVNSGLGVARALNRAPDVRRLIGLGYGPFDSGIYRGDLFDATYRMPNPLTADGLLDRLSAINAESPIDVVVPCLDGEVPHYIAIRDQLANMGIRTLLPDLKAFHRRDKANLFTGSFPKEWNSFSLPETRKVRTERGLERAAAVMGYPLMVKGAISYAIKAEDHADLHAAWTELKRKGERDVLIQRYVPGERYAVAAVCGPDHGTLCSFTIKKLRVCERGSTWSALQVTEPQLEADFADLLKRLRWIGPVEGEFIRDQVTDDFSLIEINPRSTAWIGYSADLGLNHPYLAMQVALDRPVAPPVTRGRTVFMRACEDIPVSPTAFAAIASKGRLRHD